MTRYTTTEAATLPGLAGPTTMRDTRRVFVSKRTPMDPDTPTVACFDAAVAPKVLADLAIEYAVTIDPPGRIGGALAWPATARGRQADLLRLMLRLRDRGQAAKWSFRIDDEAVA